MTQPLHTRNPSRTCPFKLKLLVLLAIFLVSLKAQGNPHALKDEAFDPIEITDALAVVLVFVAVECPISNRYAPVVNRFVETYKGSGIEFWAIYTDVSDNAERVIQHKSEYKYTLPALIDHSKVLALKAGASVTPEVCVYFPENAKNNQSAWIYRGRIDNQYERFGKWRAAPTANDLKDLLAAIANGQTDFVPTKTKAIGCYIDLP